MVLKNNNDHDFWMKTVIHQPCVIFTAYNISYVITILFTEMLLTRFYYYRS